MSEEYAIVCMEKNVINKYILLKLLKKKSQWFVSLFVFNWIALERITTRLTTPSCDIGSGSSKGKIV